MASGISLVFKVKCNWQYLHFRVYFTAKFGPSTKFVNKCTARAYFFVKFGDLLILEVQRQIRGLSSAVYRHL